MLYSLETKIIDANNGDFLHTFSYRGRQWHDRKSGRFREEQDICLVGQLDCGILLLAVEATNSDFVGFAGRIQNTDRGK